MSLIQVNKKAEVNFESDKNFYTLNCEIKAVDSEQVTLEVSKESRENLGKLAVNTKLNLNIYSLTGVVVFTSVLRSIKSKEYIIIDYPQEKSVLQRREYFRVTIQRPIEISYFDVYKDYLHKGKSIDLSGGGVRFWTAESVRVGYMATFKLYIEDLCDSKEPVNGKGRIIYTKTHESLFTTKPGYISVIKYHDISPQSLKLIMKTCFKLQIDMKQKGIL